MTSYWSGYSCHPLSLFCRPQHHLPNPSGPQSSSKAPPPEGSSGLLLEYVPECGILGAQNPARELGAAWGRKWRFWTCRAPFPHLARPTELPTPEAIQRGKVTPGLGIHHASHCGIYPWGHQSPRGQARSTLLPSSRQDPFS